jgi:quinol monooxygenase YgiN
MIIVCGYLIVDADQRSAYLGTCGDVVERARDTAGCLDYALSPDLVDAERINVLERWDDRAALEAFRGDGPSDAQREQIRFVDVHDYEVA